MRLIAILLLTILCSSSGLCVTKSDKNKVAQTDSIKKSWNFGALPAISFDTDLGFQYGGLVNFYNYGDGSRFPAYNHSIYLEASRFTKGSGIYRLYYNSDQLIKNFIFSCDITYMPDRAYDFYGFNGSESVLNKNWEETNSTGYKTRMFYKYQQDLFRFKVDLQKKIAGTHFRWITGVNLLNFNISSVNIDLLNKNKSDADKLPPVSVQPGLYEKYVKWGMIPSNEANGGFIPEVKAGVVFDSRDNLTNPMKGIWTEAVVAVIPKFLGAESGFSKISLTHRQYFTIIKNDLSFAYRLGWQQTLGGHAPFYYEPQLITSVMTGSSNTGLGGYKYLRGARRNRVVGDGVVYGNFEMRWKFARMNWIKQKFYWGLNAFVDVGQVTRNISIQDKLSNIDEPMANYFKSGAEKMHGSYGAGLRLAMNQNFIIAVDYGMVLDKQDGDSGLYIGLNYLF